MVIDAFTHILPPALQRRLERIDSPRIVNIRHRMSGVPALVDLDARFRAMDTFGEGYRQVITLPGLALEDVGDASLARELAQITNDGMAELVRDHPDRFAGFAAALPLNDVDASVDEIDRSVRELGALGVHVNTSVNGRAWDDPRFLPFWDKMAEVDRTVWVHPMRSPQFADYPGEPRSRYEIWAILGWPYDTSVFMARMVFSGLFDRHPHVKILCHHGGGVIPHLAGRIGAAWDVLGTRTPEDQREDVETSITRRPIDYFRMFYVDTAMSSAAHPIRCTLDFFGADRLLFGTDFPLIAATVDNVREAIASESAQRAILEQNALRVLNLSATSTRAAA